jgi:hypothetical protein
MSNYHGCRTTAVTPAPPGLFNVFAVCLDHEHEHGMSYRTEPCLAILLQEVQLHGQLHGTQVVFASRARNESGLLQSVYNDMSYVGTLTEAEIEAGEADRLVAQQAEFDALAETDSDLAP